MHLFFYISPRQSSQMEITPYQSVKIFGVWDQPRRFLAWEDIKEKCFTWRYLRVEIGLSPTELKRIQPDKTEWINRGALTLHILPEMTIFPVNPFEDLKADLGEFWSMKWTPEQMYQMNVTYDQLVSRGMTPDIMRLFGFSLSAWTLLGFTHNHLLNWPEDNCSLVFGMKRAELESVLKDFSDNAKSSS